MSDTRIFRLTLPSGDSGLYSFGRAKNACQHHTDVADLIALNVGEEFVTKDGYKWLRLS